MVGGSQVAEAGDARPSTIANTEDLAGVRMEGLDYIGRHAQGACRGVRFGPVPFRQYRKAKPAVGTDDHSPCSERITRTPPWVSTA